MASCRRSTTRVILFLLVATGCGSRSALGWLSLQNDPGIGLGAGGIGVPGSQAGASSASGTGSPHGAGFAGTPGIGGSASSGTAATAGDGASGAGSSGGGSGAPPAGMSGGGGASPLLDDLTTLGDDRAGYVRCSGKSSIVICEAPQECCLFQGCVSNANKCEASTLSNCDGKEDCPGSQLCCLTDVGFQCQSKCATRTIRHLACMGPCEDIDDDLIPDSVDACRFTEFEDGKGPLPEDGCSDYDGDGIHDGIDQCPKQREDGLPPNPNDGCEQK